METTFGSGVRVIQIANVFLKQELNRSMWIMREDGRLRRSIGDV
jgi:hypothetical protein